MKVILDNLILVIFALTSALVFILFVIFIADTSSQITEMEKEIIRETRLHSESHEKLLVYKNLENDFSKAQNELIEIANIEKRQYNFWRSILNSRENHMAKWKPKTPESVNADITRLFTLLRNRCNAKKIGLPVVSTKSPTIGFGSPNKKIENNFGFGFSSYDGFWPSFTNEEAKILGVQAKIIKEIIELISQSTADFHNLAIEEILRESAGQIDTKHIGKDLLVLGAEEHLLLGCDNTIESLVFMVTLRGMSSHARNFVNQLRPPFMLRNMSVERQTLETPKEEPVIDFTPNPFGSVAQDLPVAKMASQPIVKDVNSKFYFLLEYITGISNELDVLFENSHTWENADEDLLNEFLTVSGNSALIEEAKSKIFSSE